MSFHIAEIFSSHLGREFEDERLVDTESVSLGAEGSQEVEIDVDDRTGSMEVIVGWHCEKERLVVWLDGSDRFGFTWFDRLTGEEGFTTASAVNFETDCLFCEEEVSEDYRRKCSKAMVFLDREVNEYSVEEVDIDYTDMVGGDNRVWKVNTPRMRYEDIITKYICDECGNSVLDRVHEVAEEIPEEIVLRSL